MSTATEKGLISDIIASHNTLRAKHGAPPLQWDEDCAASASRCAAECASAGSMKHSHLSGALGQHGQNIYTHSASATPQAAVNSWYSECEKPGYDFNKGTFSEGTGHFTQLVWIGSQKVGAAISKDGKYLVCNYFPAGNETNQFQANVKPAGTAVTPAAAAAASSSPSAPATTAAAAAENPKVAAAPEPDPRTSRMSTETVVRVCFMKLCEFCNWSFNNTEQRRRRWLADNKHIQPPPFRLEAETHHKHKNKAVAGSSPDKNNNHNNNTSTNSSNNNNNSSSSKQQPLSPVRNASPFASHCSLSSALLALSALDETTTSEYVLEELEYYILIQTLLHGDPLADAITVPEAATLFKAKMHRPVVSFEGFQRLFEDNSGLDEAGVQRLVAMLDVQRSMHQRIAFLEDRDEGFAREQITRDAQAEAAELLSSMRRTREVAELRSQLSRATSKRIEQAQAMASMGALHLEAVKKDMRASMKTAAEAQRLAIAVETAIAQARNTAEALSEETGVNTRAFEDDKKRVLHDCHEGCREALQHAAQRWEVLDLRIERLERLMTGVGRSALVCSMSHLPLAEHQKLLPGRKNSSSSKNSANSSSSSNHNRSGLTINTSSAEQQEQDDADLDQGLEWLSLSTAERFGLMSSCHVLRDHDPGEHLVTAAVALTLSDQCVFSKGASSQIQDTVLFATVAFLALAETDTAKAFLCQSRQALPRALDILSKPALVHGAAFDEFLEMLGMELPGGAAMWRAATQHPATGAAGSGGTGGRPYTVVAGYKSAARPPPLITNSRSGKPPLPGLHNRYQPSTSSNFRVGVSAFDLTVASSTLVENASNNTNNSNMNKSGRQDGSPTAAAAVASPGSAGDDSLTFAAGHNHAQHSDFSRRNSAAAAGGLLMTSSRYADAEALVESAASVTLTEFVRCLSDVARVYLGPACAGSSAEHCLQVLLSWKVTPVAPLMPLLAMSLMLRETSTANGEENQQQQLPPRVPISRNLAASYSDMNNNDNNNNNSSFMTDRNLFSPGGAGAAGGGGGNNKPPPSPLSASRQQQQQQQQQQQYDERQALADPRYAQAWNRLVGTGDRAVPTVADVAAFLLAHFPDVMAASRGWDASTRAGFSGSEVFVVRCVVFVVMCVGTMRCPELRVDAEAFDFVRALGDYRKQQKQDGDENAADTVEDQQQQSPSGMTTTTVIVEVEKKPVALSELQEFIASRVCPWHAVLEAWTEGDQMEQASGAHDDTNASQQQGGEEAEGKFGHGDQIFKEAVARAGLPPEVLQSFPAWETIARVVKRAETSLGIVDAKSIVDG